MIAGILLAAGDSTRMGFPKALLSLNEVTFIDTILNNLFRAGCHPVISILGNAAELIGKKTSVHQFQCFRNPHPSLGMLSSLKIAIEKLPADCSGFIMTLVDHPLVQKETYGLILNEGIKTPDRIIIPEFLGRHGHPVYFSKIFFEPLLKAPDDMGARHVIKNHFEQVTYLPVDDSGILIDIDTQDEYRSNIH